MSDVATYAADQIVMTFGSNIITGFGDGSFITVDREVDGYGKRTGAQGETTRVRYANVSGSVVINLLQTSAANGILSAIHNQDMLTGNGKFPLFVKDISGTSLFSAPLAWLIKHSTGEYAADSSLRQWTFHAAKLQMFHGGNN